MKCMRCGKESKWGFCRSCKILKHKADSLISQNKSKLKRLLDDNILEPELFSRFILYTDNIIKRGKIYMEYKSMKQEKAFRFITGFSLTCSILISLWSIGSLIILWI